MLWLLGAFILGMAVGVHIQQYRWWEWVKREHPDDIKEGRRWWT